MTKAPVYFSYPLITVSPRDLLLLEHLDPKSTDVALEIGVGSGSSLFQLAGAMSELHGLDIAAGPVERLRRYVARNKCLRRCMQLLVLDFCEPDAAERLPARYDLIYSCDTLEHVAAPGAFLANVYRALKPGGRAFIAFPNEHPNIAHGITSFERRGVLLDLMRSVGFLSEHIAVQTIHMTRRAQRVLMYGWYHPRRMAKMMLNRLRKRLPAPATNPTSVANGTEEPQVFDQTDFYTLGCRLEPLAPIVNAYCWGLLKLTSWAAPVFEMMPAPDMLWDTTVLIRATRGQAPAR